MKVYIVPNPGKADAFPLMRQAGDILAREGVEILLSNLYSKEAPENWMPGVMQEELALAACDTILTIGGDGTLLHAARHALEAQKPLLGINIGRLGFLTIVESDELDKLLRLAHGQYEVERRSVLNATNAATGHSYGFGLNDIVLFKESSERSVSLDIFCDNILVSRFRGDGIIFATPTGSTAYSLSAGGPILDSRLGGIVVTQICAHIVHTPPLVFASDRVLCACSTGPEDERISISCDGTKGIVVESGEEIRICQSAKTVPMIQFNDAEQLESIDTKLKGR